MNIRGHRWDLKTQIRKFDALPSMGEPPLLSPPGARTPDGQQNGSFAWLQVRLQAMACTLMQHDRAQPAGFSQQAVWVLISRRKGCIVSPSTFQGWYLRALVWACKWAAIRIEAELLQ